MGNASFINKSINTFLFGKKSAMANRWIYNFVKATVNRIIFEWTILGYDNQVYDKQALVLCSLKMLLQCSWWRDPYSQLIFIHVFVLSTICFRKGHLYLFWNDWNSVKYAVIIRRTIKCTFLILEFYPISKKQHILQQK